ncbi:ABC transporter permease [Chiayiivirga flava]|uniref:ABC-type polysaccharide/polyol phosphate export permease n=1 Tax=Chiayiivirga flava TaxID=659595 RepID=A0A7W8G2Y3_9GAMM|nr:ABC transporter permease [Chiayiivirga flava]MBB5209165.1 ABC-type polysaccharide/polyol phosphate export permease [Chiayiivirga flava]
MKLIRDLWTNRGVLYAQLIADLRASVVGTRMGYLWWLLDPLLLMAIYYFLVQGVLERGGEDYAFFIFCGIVPWQWFARSMQLAATAYTRNKGLILSVPVPYSVYVLSPIVLHSAFALIGLGLMLAVYDVSLLWRLPLVLPLMLLQLLLTFGIGLLLASATVFLRDLAKFADYGIRILFYLSPVIYAVDRVLASETMPALAKTVFMLNPFAHLLPAYRDLLMQRWGNPPGPGLVLIALLALALIWAGAWLNGRLRNRIPQAL